MLFDDGEVQSLRIPDKDVRVCDHLGKPLDGKPLDVPQASALATDADAIGSRKRRSAGEGSQKDLKTKKKQRLSHGAEEEAEAAAKDVSGSDDEGKSENEGDIGSPRSAKSKSKRPSEGGPGGPKAKGKKLTWVASESADALSRVAAENLDVRVLLKNAAGEWLKGSICRVLKEGKEAKDGQMTPTQYGILLESGEEVSHTLPSEQVQVGLDMSEIEQMYASKGLRLRESGRWEAHVRMKGKKKYIGMFDSARSAAEAHDKVMAKLRNSSAAVMKASFKAGTRVCAVGKEGDSSQLGTVLSFDWITEMYKISLGEGKLVTSPLPAPEYTILDVEEGGKDKQATHDSKKEKDKEKEAAHDSSVVAVQTYRGVRSTQEAGKWAAEIKRDGRQIRLGVWESMEAAARAYDMAAHEYQGERAKLNFPERVQEYAKELEQQIAVREAESTPDVSAAAAADSAQEGGGVVAAGVDGGAKGGVKAKGKSARAKFEYAVGQRLRVLYDDGVWYPGKIVAHRFVQKGPGSNVGHSEYDILLDDGETKLTSPNPGSDPDIQIITTPNQSGEGEEPAKASHQDDVEDKASYIGVRRRDGYWVAELKRSGQTIKLGHFDSASDAARAYDTAALKYQGDRAKVNFEESRQASDASHYLHSRVRVLYDDGVWYEGIISGYDHKSKEYMIRLDDDTRFSTPLPDPDIQILSTSALPPKGVVTGAGLASAAAAPSSAATVSAAGGPGAGGVGVKKQSSVQQDLSVGVRLRVLYDDGVYYPGTVIGYHEGEKKYRIRLDEGTKFTSALPDNDIEILGLPPSSLMEKFSSMMEPWRQKAARRAGGKPREHFEFPPTVPDSAIAASGATETTILKETAVLEPTCLVHEPAVHYHGVKRLGAVEGVGGMWCAELALCGHVRNLGIYDTPEEAAVAYNKAIEWFRIVASSAAGSVCEYASCLEALVLNPVDGVAFEKGKHAPPHANEPVEDNSQGDTSRDGMKDSPDVEGEEGTLGAEFQAAEG